MRNLLAIFICVMLSAASAVAMNFKVKADGRVVEATAFCDISYVCLEGESSVNIEVTCDETVTSCELSPLDMNIPCRTKGRRVSFKLAEYGWYVLRVNGLHRLFVFHEAPEKVPDGLNAKDYPSLQAAFDAASGSGRTMVVSAGEYVCGTLRIGSNSDIYIAGGAVLKATDSRADFPADEDRPEADHVNHPESYSDNGERMTFSRMLLIEGENIKLRGRGVIDGNGGVLRSQGKPANLIRVRNSRNVTIEGLVLRNPAAWNTHILGCSDVTVRGVKIVNDPLVHNTDGIDPDSSDNVTVENCFAYCSDDNIAVKSSNNSNILNDVHDITVRNCVFLTRKSSLKVGTETKAEQMYDILFKSNCIVECDRAFALYCNDGADFHDIVFEGNVVENNWPDNQRKAIHFKISRRCGAGRIRNVTIRNCRLLRPFPGKSEIRGLDGEHMVEDVQIVDSEGFGTDFNVVNAKNVKL